MASPQVQVQKLKRPGGRMTLDGNWRVTSESTQQPDGSWLHNPCGGTEIMGRQIVFSHRDGVGPLTGSGKTVAITVPFCPECELKPLSGVYTEDCEGNRKLLVTQWG